MKNKPKPLIEKLLRFPPNRNPSLLNMFKTSNKLPWDPPSFLPIKMISTDSLLPNSSHHQDPYSNNNPNNYSLKHLNNNNNHNNNKIFNLDNPKPFPIELFPAKPLKQPVSLLEDFWITKEIYLLDIVHFLEELFLMLEAMLSPMEINSIPMVAYKLDLVPLDLEADLSEVLLNLLEDSHLHLYPNRVEPLLALVEPPLQLDLNPIEKITNLKTHKLLKIICSSNGERRNLLIFLYIKSTIS